MNYIKIFTIWNICMHLELQVESWTWQTTRCSSYLRRRDSTRFLHFSSPSRFDENARTHLAKLAGLAANMNEDELDE